jgi:hypothetical protein
MIGWRERERKEVEDRWDKKRVNFIHNLVV